MKARATEIFTISFSSKNIGKYDAVAVGDSELIRDGDESRRKSKTNPLPFYLRATTVAPFLTLDKLVLLTFISSSQNKKIETIRWITCFEI